jgi:hypothetical protein
MSMGRPEQATRGSGVALCHSKDFGLSNRSRTERREATPRFRAIRWQRSRMPELRVACSGLPESSITIRENCRGLESGFSCPVILKH